MKHLNCSKIRAYFKGSSFTFVGVGNNSWWAHLCLFSPHYARKNRTSPRFKTGLRLKIRSIGVVLLQKATAEKYNAGATNAGSNPAAPHSNAPTETSFYTIVFINKHLEGKNKTIYKTTSPLILPCTYQDSEQTKKVTQFKLWQTFELEYSSLRSRNTSCTIKQNLK